MSIIFSGDFRQLEQGQTDSQLLYTTQSNMYFENLLNAALILENKHRFKEDPVYGQMMSDMWFGDLSIEQKKEINKRLSWTREQYLMYSMMIVTTRVPQTNIEISYRQITFDGIYW
jgi:hypothetical protein